MIRPAPRPLRRPSLVSAASVLLVAGAALGQEAPVAACGLELTPEEAAEAARLLDAGMYTPPPGSLRGGCQIPLTIHIVRRSNGTGGLEQQWVDQCIQDANAAYAEINVSFYQAGPTLYIDSDALYTIDNDAETNQLRNMQVAPGTINIYFVNSAPYCGISSFTFSSVQGIVMHNGCTPRAGNHSTFSHELGHYFDLFHTHETAAGGRECTSGSNCAVAGDNVCDTPADPGLSGAVNPSCVYTGSASGPCAGDPPYNPPTRNYMSYSRASCRTEFTPGQYARALATLMNLRTELACAGQCAADWDHNGMVNSFDISDFLSDWLYSLRWDVLRGDFDGSGAVNSADVSAFLTAWLAGVQGDC